MCDNPLAIEAGTRLYGEPKYPDWFEATRLPLNGPAAEEWSVTCKDADLTENGGFLRHQRVLLSSAVIRPASPQPGQQHPDHRLRHRRRRLRLAGLMNVYQSHEYCFQTPWPSSPVRLTVRDATSPIGTT